MSQTSNTPEQALRVMQIIAAALASGVVLFGLIAVFALGALSEEPDGQLISLLAAALTVFAFVGHLIVPRLIVQQQPGAPDPHNVMSLYAVYQAQMIVGLAILEGMAFFNIVASIIEHNWWSLAIAGCLVAWMLMAFPARRRVEHWVEMQQMNAGIDTSNR